MTMKTKETSKSHRGKHIVGVASAAAIALAATGCSVGSKGTYDTKVGCAPQGQTFDTDKYPTVSHIAAKLVSQAEVDAKTRGVITKAPSGQEHQELILDATDKVAAALGTNSLQAGAEYTVTAPVCVAESRISPNAFGLGDDVVTHSVVDPSTVDLGKNGDPPIAQIPTS